MYLHVPFCTVRCGYCDFNTYTATELGGGASQHAYADTALREIDLAADVLLGRAAPSGRAPSSSAAAPRRCCPPPTSRGCSAGCGTPAGCADGAEVTTEANPDSVTPESLAALRRRPGSPGCSFGMQSAVPHVLATLDRTHDPRRIPDVVRWARDAGLAVSAST